MCRLKNRHFTLRRACTHLDHLAPQIHGDTGTLQPVCAHNKDSVVVFLGLGGCPFTLQHQGLVPNFVAISKIKDKQKHSRLRPLLMRRKRWEEMRQRDEWRDKTREADIWIQASTRLSKKGRHRRKAVNERRLDLTGRLFLRPERSVCVYSAS